MNDNKMNNNNLNNNNLNNNSDLWYKNLVKSHLIGNNEV